MSFTVTYKDLTTKAFISGMRKLKAHSFENHLTAYSVARIVKHLDEEIEIKDDLASKILAKYRGKPEAKDDLVAELKEFEKVSFEVKRAKVKFSETAGAGLNPEEILALDSLLEVPDGE